MRFFFDHRDSIGPEFLRDEDGVELPDVKNAKTEAALALAEYAKDVLPNSENRTLSIEVRDDDGPVLSTRLVYDYAWR